MTASGPGGYRFFFSLIVSDCVCETGLPPRRGWKVNLAITGTPCPCLKAFLSAYLDGWRFVADPANKPAVVAVLAKYTESDDRLAALERVV